MFVAHRHIPKKISVGDDFIALKDVAQNGDLEFEVTYSVDQSEVISSGVSIVKLTAYATRKREYSIFENSSGQRAGAQDVVDNILNLQRAYRNIVRANENHILATAISDVTAKINNQIVSYVRSPRFSKANNSISRVQQLFKTKVTLKEVSKMEDETGEHHAILQTNRNNLPNNDVQSTVRQSIRSMIMKKGVDPSRITDLKNDRVSSGKNLRGTYVPPTRNTGYRWGDDENSDVVRQTFTQMMPGTTTKLTTTEEIPAHHLIQTIQTVSIDKIDVPVKFIIPSSKLSNARGAISVVFVKLDVMNRCGVIVDTIEKELDIAFHLRLFNTPKLAPIVKFARYESLSKGTLQVFQQDPTATAVRVYRKYMYHVSNVIDDYVLVGEFSVAKGAGFANIPIDLSRKDTSIYRVVPVSSEGIVGFEYSNIVINPPGGNKNKFRYVSLTSKIVSNGVSLEIRDIPAEVVGFKVLRKDKTLFDDSYSVVGDIVTYVDRSKDDQIYSVVDNQAKNDHTYEYVAELVYRNGSTDLSGYAIVEYSPLAENLVDTRIVDLTTSSDPIKPDVSFNIESKLTDGNLDSIKNLLEKQGLSQFYAANILKERDKLKQIIAHHVTRVNLTLGIRENFGVVTTGAFTDSELGKINSVSPLQQGYRYRYDVSTLLRTPETLFETFEKTATDPITKKSYTFNPSKFFHPITMKKGNILDRETQLARYAKEDMSFGNVGDLVTAEVSFANEIVTVTDVRALKYDRYHVLLKWTLNGSAKLIEHFIVVLEENNMQVPIGKVQTNEEKRQYEFIHILPIDEVGNYTYTIIPVFSDYTMGAEKKSNKVIIV